MKFARCRLFFTAACLAVALIFGATPLRAQAPAPGQPLPLDFQALERGKDALNQQKYPDAVKIFEDLLKTYPQSAAVAEATFRLGYAYYLGGDYDKSVLNFQKVPAIKSAAPEIVELATSLVPQVLAAKAAKMDPTAPARDGAFQEVVKEFDAFLTKFPKSDEVESANYGKGLAYFQIKKYDEAAKPLRLNLQTFPQSESIQDSQFLLALVLAADGVTIAQRAPTVDPAAFAKLDESEKLLRDIVAKRVNMAVVNDAQFQLGEMLSTRASLIDADKNKDQREAAYRKAIEAYRGVFSKDQVLAAQKARIDGINARRLDAGKQGNVLLFRKLQRLQEKEQEKLAGFQERADQTVVAKVKSAEMFFQLNRFDETRVLLSYLEPTIDDPEGKKEPAYYITMTYALQGLLDKAVERYNSFQATYKADPIAQNLQLVMAAGFLNKDSKGASPEKAIDYCKEGLTMYPKGRFVPDLLNVEASALIGLKRYEEAQKLLKQFVATKPAKELAADAEFNLAIIFKDTGKVPDAIKTFREVVEKYPGTRQAEQGAYWIGQIQLDAGQGKEAVAELKAFASKYPDSELMPQALFATARGEAMTNQSDAALETFSTLEKKYPKSEAAPYAYFERAKLYAGRQALDECLKIMKDFIAAYPDSTAMYQAYDFMAQILVSQSKGMEAIDTYGEYLKKRPNEPTAAEALLKQNSLWKAYAEAQGPILAQDEKKRAEWTKGTENSIAAGEQIVERFPESASLALALNNLLDVQKSRLKAKLTTEDDIEKYFVGLAAKAEGKAETQSKIRFTLAAFLSEKDKTKAVKLMGEAYNPELKYAPDDIDLYGQALITAKDYDKALSVYEKLAKDYPLPGNDPKKAPRNIQEAQAIALAGQGQALQGKGDKEGGAKKFKELEDNYAWSPKMMEVHYGIAQDLHEKKQDDDAIKRLLEVVKAPKAPAVLRANSMLLLGKIHEANQRFDAAIDNYIKIATFYQGVPEAASEGLWRGAQLLERQAKGELPMPTPPPKAAPGAKPAGSPAPDKKA